MWKKAKQSFEQFATSVQDDWATALSSHESKRHTSTSPGGTVTPAQNEPLFSQPQKAAMSTAVNRVLHRAMTDFSDDLDGRLKGIETRQDVTDSNVSTINHKLIDHEKKATGELQKLGALVNTTDANHSTLRNQFNELQQNFSRMMTAFEDLKKSRADSLDGAPLAQAEVVEELKEIRSQNAKLNEELVNVKQSQVRLGQQRPTVVHVPAPPPGLNSVPRPAGGSRVPWSLRKVGVMGNITSATTVPLDVAVECEKRLKDAGVADADYSKVEPVMWSAQKCFMCDVHFVSPDALAAAREKIAALNFMPQTGRTCWLGTKQTEQERLPSILLTRALKYLKYLESELPSGHPDDLRRVALNGEKYIDFPNGDKLFEVTFGKAKWTKGGRARYSAEACAEGIEWINNLELR